MRRSSAGAFVELQQALPKGVQAVAIRSGGQNRVPDPTTILQADDVLLLVGTDPAAIATALGLVGEASVVDRGRSNGARLHSRLRLEGRRSRNAPRQPETTRWLRLQLHPRAAG